MVLYWKDMTRVQIGIAAKTATAVVPIGAIEQHGYHLPVSTDNVLIEAIAKLSVERASEQIPIVLAPVVPFGFSHHHLIYPGALSLSTDTLLKVMKELVECIVQSGFRKIFILNGHGGNEEIVRLTARNAALEHQVTVGAASFWTMAWDSLSDFAMRHQFPGIAGHAGQFETSLMLALQEHLVHLEQIKDINRPVKVPANYKGLLERPRIERPSAWQEIDGFTDNPLTAKREYGEQLLDIIARDVATQLISFHESS